jgi:predicted permease
LRWFILKRFNIINESFVDVTSKFVFSVSFRPRYFKSADIDLRRQDLNQIIYIYSTLTFSYLDFLSGDNKRCKNLSVFVQGAYRSNYAIVGLAIISKLFGESALGKATILLAFILPLYNVLAVIILTVPFRKERKLNLKTTLSEIVFNPLIVAVIAGLPFSYFKIKIPEVGILTIDF